MSDLQFYLSSYFPISKTKVDAIQSFFQKERLNKSDFYTKKGLYCDKLSFIHSGHLRIFDRTEAKEVTQWISGKGHFITDIKSFIFDQEAKWYIQALDDCEIFTIYKKDYNRIEQAVSEWPHLEKLFISQCFDTLEQRVFSLLSLSAKERYQQYFSLFPEYFNTVPLQYLASLLGMTPETLSRIRSNNI